MKTTHIHICLWWQKILKKKGVPYIGTRLTEDAPVYTVQEINGIRIGITAYTYETGRPKGLKTINGIPVKEKDNKTPVTGASFRANKVSVGIS